MRYKRIDVTDQPRQTQVCCLVFGLINEVKVYAGNDLLMRSRCMLSCRFQKSKWTITLEQVQPEQPLILKIFSFDPI